MINTLKASKISAGKIGILILASIVFIGCDRSRNSNRLEQAGFLTDYKRLKSEGWFKGEYWANPEFKLEDYDAIIVPKVELWVAKEKKDDLDPEEAGRLQGMFRDQAIDKLKARGWKITDKPGKRVATLKLALTELDAGQPYLRAVTTLAPYLSAGIKVLAIGADVHVFVGEVSTEVQILNSEKKTILAEAMDRRVGEQSALAIGSTWGDVEDAIDVWTDRIAEGLDKTKPRGS